MVSDEDPIDTAKKVEFFILWKRSWLTNLHIKINDEREVVDPSDIDSVLLAIDFSDCDILVIEDEKGSAKVILKRQTAS